VLRGEPELTLRELVDTLEVGRWKLEGGGGNGEVATGGQTTDGGRRRDPGLWARLEKIFREADPEWRPAWEVETEQPLGAIKGLVWRGPVDGSGEDCEIRVNADRPYIRDLDDLPLPLHHLLPWEQYRAPNIRGPYTFIVPSRGCPAGCTFCIKHVSYGYSVRVRSPENVVEELKLLWELGLRNVHMYADLFTVNREQVMGICKGLLSKPMIDEGLAFKWTCNSRVDFVDPEMLETMGRAGCWMIAWGIESANEGIRKGVRKGTTDEQISRALQWSKAAGIMNWGYFILGLPGETEDTIRETIELAKRLPLDLALFHIAAPYPGTPFFFEVVEEGWFRPGTTWEEVDMDESTVLDYPGLPAERIEYWARRAFREWALRPGPMWTFVKSMRDWYAVKSAVNAGWQALGWMR
jgi:anaerobic magnesium-protoporphyrin IX monomethyl ester cyclase